jgi:hypothetical protein
MSNKDDEFDDLTIDINAVRTPLNLDTVKENLPKYSSQKLCEMIVCDRYFGCYKAIAIMCMEELAARRTAGDEYNFEDYIDKAFNELPKLDFSIPDIGDVLRQVINRKLKK